MTSVKVQTAPALSTEEGSMKKRLRVKEEEERCRRQKAAELQLLRKSDSLSAVAKESRRRRSDRDASVSWRI